MFLTPFKALQLNVMTPFRCKYQFLLADALFRLSCLLNVHLDGGIFHQIKDNNEDE